MRLIILCSLLILVSCGSSVLGRGKKELRNGNYQEAIKYFEDAKIDQRNNEAIDKLIEMANSKITDARLRGLDKIRYDKKQEEEERLRKEAKEKAQKSDSPYDYIISEFKPPKAFSFIEVNYTAAITTFKQNYDTYMRIITGLKQTYG